MKKFKPPTKAECQRAIKRLKEMEAIRTQPKPACNNCRYWHRTCGSAGQCRRYPPIIDSFPAIQTMQWCGEFEAKK